MLAILNFTPQVETDLIDLHLPIARELHALHSLWETYRPTDACYS